VRPSPDNENVNGFKESSVSFFRARASHEHRNPSV
jgi:hypothetical protein